MATPATPQSSPLDLDQFAGFNEILLSHAARAIECGPFYGKGDARRTDATTRLLHAAPALLSECRRQREEIARLRAAARLGSLALDAMISARGDVCDGGDLRSLFPTGDEDAIKALDALDAALASEGGAE